MSKKEVPEEIKRDCVKLWRDFNYNLTRIADLSGLGIAEVREYVHEYVREEQHAPKNDRCYDALRRKIVSELTQFRAGKPGEHQQFRLMKRDNPKKWAAGLKRQQTRIAHMLAELEEDGVI